MKYIWYSPQKSKYPLFILHVFSIQIEDDQLFGDDTALNSVMLQCADLHGNHKVAEVESDEGNWGTWTDLISCNMTYDQSASDNDTVPFDFIVGFRLEVESQQVLAVFHWALCA